MSIIAGNVSDRLYTLFDETFKYTCDDIPVHKVLSIKKYHYYAKRGIINTKFI